MAHICKENQFFLVKLLYLLFLKTFLFQRKSQCAFCYFTIYIIENARNESCHIDYPCPPRIIPRRGNDKLHRYFLQALPALFIYRSHMQRIFSRIQISVIQFRLFSLNPILVQTFELILKPFFR